MFLRNYLQHEIPRIIIHTASTAIRNFGGQKQLKIRPKAKAMVIKPLLCFLLRIIHPPILHYIHNIKKGYINVIPALQRQRPPLPQSLHEVRKNLPNWQ